MSKLSDLTRVLTNRHNIKQLVRARCFPEQLAFIESKQKRRILFTPRRSGKSTACALLLFQEAMLYAGRELLYLGLSKESAARAIWFDCLEPLLAKHNIKHTYNKVDRTVGLPNGSRIKISGLDSSQREQKKLLGGKYHLAIIDEAQDQIQDLHAIIYKALGPAMSDMVLKDGGIIVLAGTPGDVPDKSRLWYRLTRPLDPSEVMTAEEHAERLEWQPGFHQWNVTDNPHMAKEFAKVCEDLHRRYGGPRYREDPIFRKEWLGEWVQQLSRRVYSFTEANLATMHHRTGETEEQAELVDRFQSLLRGDRYWDDRRGRRYTWHYLIGCDLGWVDATAIVVTAYSDQDDTFYVIKSDKVNGATVANIAGKLIALDGQYRPDKILVDTSAGGKQIAESIRREHGLPIFGANKQEKQNHVARMNSDFTCGKVRILAETNPELTKELAELVLDQKAFERHEWKEAERFDNHGTDSLLYAYKEALHHFSQAPEEPIKAGTTEAADAIRAMRTRPLQQDSRERRSGTDPYDAWNKRRDAKALAWEYIGKRKKDK